MSRYHIWLRYTKSRILFMRSSLPITYQLLNLTIHQCRMLPKLWYILIFSSHCNHFCLSEATKQQRYDHWPIPYVKCNAGKKTWIFEALYGNTLLEPQKSNFVFQTTLTSNVTHSRSTFCKRFIMWSDTLSGKRNYHNDPIPCYDYTMPVPLITSKVSEVRAFQWTCFFKP